MELVSRMLEYDFVDLFAGIGGTRHAFEKEDGNCVFSCEIDHEARTVYEQNWDDEIQEIGSPQSCDRVLW
jgi:DNA (cytosine-5)-methyltransferase 1